MKRPNMLSATCVKTVNVPGRHGDGRGGLGLSMLVRSASRGGLSKCWTMDAPMHSSQLRAEGDPDGASTAELSHGVHYLSRATKAKQRHQPGTVKMTDTLIDRNPDILGGTPVFAGTRVPVRILMEHLEAGDRLDDFLADYPTVSRSQAVALLERAATMLVSGGDEAAA